MASKRRKGRSTAKSRTKSRETVTRDPDVSARMAIKAATPRKDTSAAMMRIHDRGHEFNESEARALDADEVGYYIEKTVTVVITPDHAEELFIYHNYKGQRSFDQAHATQLAKSMKVAPAIAFAIDDSNHAQCVNGQHTLWAIRLRGKTTQAAVTIFQCRDFAVELQLFF